MDAIIEKIRPILENAKDQIQMNLEANKINASGRTSESIHVEEYDGGIRLVGGGENCAPASTLEVGRTSGRVPVGMTDILVQWSKDKGISFSSDRERRTFAYFLKKRIMAEGTLRQKSPVDVYSSVIEDAAIAIEGKLFATIKEQIYSNF